jgi:hypothetical protein
MQDAVGRSRLLSWEQAMTGVSSESQNGTREISTRAGGYWRDDRGIIHGCVHPKAAEMTLADAEADVAACLALAEGQKRRIVIDMRGIKSHTRECRAYFQAFKAKSRSSSPALVR